MGIWNYFDMGIQKPDESSFSYVKFVVIVGGISLVLFGTGYAMVGLAKVRTSFISTNHKPSIDDNNIPKP